MTGGTARGGNDRPNMAERLAQTQANQTRCCVDRSNPPTSHHSFFKRHRQPQAWRLLLVFWIVALTLLFPYADRYRNSQVSQEVRHPSTYFAQKGDYDSSSQIGHAVEYRREIGSTNGSQLLGAVGFWVPREVWHDKPDATGPILARFIGFPFENVSSPLWAETYMGGGVAAVILMFIGVGLASDRIDAWKPASQTSGIDLRTLAYPLVSTYSLILFRGSLLSVIGPFVGLCLFLFLITKMQPEQKTKP